MFVTRFADDLEADGHPIRIETAWNAGGCEADGVDRMGVRQEPPERNRRRLLTADLLWILFVWERG